VIKKILRNFLRLLAGWVVRFHRPKQLILKLISLSPTRVDDWLRRAIAPVVKMDGLPPNVPDQLSANEKILLRDLSGRQFKRQSNRGNTGEKMRLAYFSPMPPQKSGISNYSAMLLPQLASRFEIDVIVNQKTVDDSALEPAYRVMDYEYFRKHAGEYDRILYHMGNSSFHTHMFEALEHWPGVVVLHDFFLGHVIRHMDNVSPGYLAQCLYQGWGFSLLSERKNNLHSEDIIWDCPLNAGVLQNALGIIAHSQFCRSLTEEFYGNSCHQNWHFIPHLRDPAPEIDKRSVRDKLGIPATAFVVCSFGHITPTKLHDRILRAWQSSRLYSNPDCWLVFVGELAEGPHRRIIISLIHKTSSPRIKITGWVDAKTFDCYLAAADAAVQLRSRSRGETSGAVIDCLNHGLSTIVNSHGTMVDLPEQSVYRLPDEFEDQELITGLEKIYFNSGLRQSLATTARTTILENHSPSTCGELYYQAIENIYKQKEPYWTAIDKVLDLMPVINDSGIRLDRVPPDLKKSFSPLFHRPQLLVDVSAIVHVDLQTGIERVVRAQLLELVASPLSGYRVEPVYLYNSNGNWHYHYARSYGWRLLEVPYFPPGDEKVDFTRDDILYIPDLKAHSVVSAHKDGLFRAIKIVGTTINVLIHDILPVSHPEYFPSWAKANHEAWLRVISECSDQIICVSRSVADEYRNWLELQSPVLTSLPVLSVNHHGANISASKPTTGLPRKAKTILSKLAKAPTFLMVGTIEPRKGYLETLEVFERLWQAGLQANLVIVGKEGWMNLPPGERKNIPETIKRLAWHPRRDKQLFWLSGISDEFLEAIYASSECLIAASIAEGFGLPLIEAAQHGMAIVARDIAVFREVAGDFALYFDERENNLENVLRSLLSRYERSEYPTSKRMPLRSWSDNVEQLKQILLAGHEHGAEEE